MAIKLGDAIVFIKGDSSQLNRDLDKSEGKTRGFANRVGGLLRTGITAGAVGAAGAIAGIGIAAGKAAFDAMPIEGIAKSFQGLTGDADAALAKLREGSLGMVRDAELMRGYNEAAQLVGKSFADELPNAMQYLGKVSAATGQDMGFMLDSLTKGVGRMSPMILDNLGIQVNLTEANEAYAASLGKSADELTKQEQQAALMAQVMEKLAENTASMPGITDNAATKWAQLKTTFGNLKDELGVALLPTLTALLNVVGDLAREYGPAVVDFLSDKLIPVISNFVKLIVYAPDEGGVLLDYLGELPKWLQPVAIALAEVAIWISEKLVPALKQFGAWLFGEGIPALVAFMEPILAQLIPGLAQLAKWIGDIAKFLLPILADAIGFVIDNFHIFGPILGVIAGLILALTSPISLVIGAIILLATAWANNWGDIQGKTKAATDFIKSVIKVFKAILEGDFTALTDFLTSIWRDAWDAIQALVKNAKQAILDTLSNLFNSIKELFSLEKFKEIGASIVEGIKQGIEDAWGAVVSFFDDKISELLGSIKDFLGIGSPSRVFMKIGEEIQAGLALGLMQNQALPAQAMSQSIRNVTQNYYQTIHTSRVGSVSGEFQQMRALLST